MRRVGVLGGGISGLTAAFQLGRRGIDVTVFEQNDQAGGVIRTERSKGFLVELGPNTLRSRSTLLDDLLAALHLEGQVLQAAPATRHRYIVRDGRPVVLPTSPAALLTSSFLSLRGKLRLLKEPFVPAAEPGTEESVAAFVRRRLGEEALTYGADPFVAGIFAGDPDQLAVHHAFPLLNELEQQFGSLLKGGLRRARAARQVKQEDQSTGSRSLFSFRDGMQQLPNALAAALGARLKLNTRVTGLQASQTGWTVMLDNDSSHSFDAVVSTIPLHQLPDLALPFPIQPLEAVRYPPIAVLGLGFRRKDVAHPLDGFGLLMPAAERAFRLLGVLFSSTLFPNRAPDGHVLLTVLTGGARHPALAGQPEDKLLALVLDDLDRLLGVRGNPVFMQSWKWPHAIPQYNLGYGAVKDRIDEIESAHSGLFFAGNYRQGISVGDTMASGQAAARRVGSLFDR